MKNKLFWLYVLLGVAFLWSLLFIYPEQPIILIAKSIVPVFGSERDAMSLPKDKALTNLMPQQKVKVISCVDVKHYLIYKVHLDDERTGFVNEGDYTLLRDGKPSICR